MAEGNKTQGLHSLVVQYTGLVESLQREKDILPQQQYDFVLTGNNLTIPIPPSLAIFVPDQNDPNFVISSLEISRHNVFLRVSSPNNTTVMTTEIHTDSAFAEITLGLEDKVTGKFNTQGTFEVQNNLSLLEEINMLLGDLPPDVLQRTLVDDNYQLDA